MATTILNAARLGEIAKEAEILSSVQSMLLQCTPDDPQNAQGAHVLLQQLTASQVIPTYQAPSA